MLFQTLDDKTECIGVYADGKLFFENLPQDLTHTWKITTVDTSKEIQSAWIYSGGKSLQEAAPQDLLEKLEDSTRKLRAYLKAFKLAKVNLREHCFFDMVPKDFLEKYCETKNEISEHVFKKYQKPENYEHLLKVHTLLQKIRAQKLTTDTSDCKNLFLSSVHRKTMNNLLSGDNYIDYNLFGTVTGRLTTMPDSFPILTLKKDFRKIIKPKNDWFVSLDYNGAEVRTLLSLTGEEQPSSDIHDWNALHLFEQEVTRDECKTRFFAWLYDPSSEAISTELYSKEKALTKWYDGDYVTTPFNRKIKVDERKALNYLIQSTTSDLVLDRAVAIDEYLKDKKSFISHIVHDEIVVDLADDERAILSDVKSIFSSNKLANYMVNLRCGKNYLELKELNI